MPLADENGSISIPEITRTIKSESAHRINKALGRTGQVWQDESFDHILRGDESLGKKVLYILENPIRVRGWRLAQESIDGCGGTRT